MNSVSKSVLSILSVLSLSSIALAMPTVGDTATYDVAGVRADNGQPFHSQDTEMLTQFDASRDMFEQSSTVTDASGKTQTTKSWVSTDELMTDAKLQNLLTNCAALGGRSESITTAAGTFNTCRTQDQDGTILNYANVPFGMLKGHSGEMSYDLTLMSFKFGH